MKKIYIGIIVLAISVFVIAGGDRTYDFGPSVGTLSDGDYGDITVSSSGTAMNVDAGALSDEYASSAGIDANILTLKTTYDFNDIATAYQAASFNAGTDPNADLEEETHATEHAVGGGDTIFPADPDADAFLQWDDTNGVSIWTALADLFATSAETKEAVEDWVGLMLPETLTYQDDSNDILKTDFYKFNIPDPNYQYGIDTQICIEPNVPAITIVEITVTCDADPTTELDWDLKFADAFIGLANATLIVACDTTNGAADVDSGFNDATVPAGKTVYMEFGAQPDGDINQVCVKVKYTYD